MSSTVTGTDGESETFSDSWGDPADHDEGYQQKGDEQTQRGGYTQQDEYTRAQRDEYTPRKASTNPPFPGSKQHIKRNSALPQPRSLEKRSTSVGTFLKNNFVAIVGGAVVTAGGLWLWDRFMKKRAERAARKNSIAGGGMQGGKQVNVVLDTAVGMGEGADGRKTGEGARMLEKEAGVEGDGLLDDAAAIGTDPGEEDSGTESEKGDVCTDCEHC